MLRRATFDDIALLSSIEQRSFLLAWSEANFRAELEKGYSFTYIYYQNNMPVAYISIWELLDEGEILSIAVLPDVRGQGIATEILSYVFERHSGVLSWHLEVDSTNEIAIKLYKKRGFEANRLIKNYYSAGRDAIQMKMSVNEGKGLG
ncbi:ribosomal protein S18-alanine N-acetyltransferase [Deferribacterales bacterium RsTz2092]|nr:ribosomal-protein-alanine N-acetyltransferase RimI [Deferribacterales bacterium]